MGPDRRALRRTPVWAHPCLKRLPQVLPGLLLGLRHPDHDAQLKVEHILDRAISFLTTGQTLTVSCSDDLVFPGHAVPLSRNQK